MNGVTCEPSRTAVGGFGRVMRDRRAHIPADAPVTGLLSALDAGLPGTVTGLQIDRRRPDRTGETAVTQDEHHRTANGGASSVAGVAGVFRPRSNEG